MNKKKCLTLLLLLATVVMAAQPLARDPQLRMGKLKNGLTYYIYPNANPKGEAVYRLFVKAGSVQERDDQRGLAHFLEHLAFNGTTHFPGDGIVRFLESKGAKFGKDLNAHTSFSETVYKLQLPSTDRSLVDSTLTILSDWAGGLLIAPEEVEKERGVILSEWLSRGGTSTDNSMRLVMELLNGSRYSRRITIGDTAIIRHATPQTIREYYKRWYQPQLMAVAVVGDVDADMMERMIREKFSTLPAGVPLSALEKESLTPSIPRYTDDVTRIAIDSKVKTTELDMLMLLPQPRAVETTADYRDYLQRSLLNSLMKLRFNSLSFDNPAYEKGTVQYARFLGAVGVVDASVELSKGKMRQGIRDFIRHYRQVYDYGFMASEIMRAKKSLLSSLRSKVESGEGERSTRLMEDVYSDFYGQSRMISRKDELLLMEKLLPVMDSVGMLRYVHRVLAPGPQHHLLRGSEDVQTEFADSLELFGWIRQCQREPVERYWKNIRVPDELVSLPVSHHIISEQALKAIGAVDMHLDNGVRVIFRHTDTEHDRLMLSGFRKGGQYSLDSMQYYTALVAPSIVNLSGAGHLSREELNYYLAGNTASVRLLVDKLRTGVAASAHHADLKTMFQLLFLRWTQPCLDTATCRITLEKLVENFRAKKETPQSRFSRELGWLINGRNYTNEELTDTLVQQMIRTADMLPLHERFFGPANGYTFVILSDMELDDVRPYINTYLGTLPSGKVDTTWTETSCRRIPHRDITFIRHAADGDKATVSLIFQQDSISGNLQKQELQAMALKAILRSALLKRLREEMGKVYSVSVSVSSGRYPAYLSRSTIAFNCRPEDVDSLIAAVHETLQQLYDHPELLEDYLNDVKKNLVKEHDLMLQQTSYWTSWIRNSVYSGNEDWTWFSRYNDVVRQMTINDVSAYARHILRDAYQVKAVLLPADGQHAENDSRMHRRASRIVSGTVFSDHNRNGIQDPGEKGVKNILVSNGDTIVRTDRQGTFALSYKPGSSIFPILPADYTLTRSAVMNAAFCYMDADSMLRPASFGVVKKKVNRRFRLNAVGDVQVSDYEELDYATRTLWPELLEPCDQPTINLFLGDLVNDNLKLYGDLHTLLEQLPQQTWTVLGNHDRDTDSIRWRQTRSYGAVFGADMYAFNEGRAHFIVLNNVYGVGNRGYKGRLSERQLRFVEQNLKYVPKDRLVVLCMHIPLAHTDNSGQLMKLLEGRGDVLAITGHMHQVGRYYHEGKGVQVHELSAGASCGFWWVGERETDGVPAALQQGGTPRNYFVLDFDDNRYRIRCKAIGQDEHRQMSIHVTGIDTLDAHLRDLQGVPDGLVLMTVYGGSDSTRVRCRVDGGAWKVCEKTMMTDRNVARTREMNLQHAYPTMFSRRNPMRRTESRQLWSFALPSVNCKGAHTIEVEADDRWGFHAAGRRSFCFPGTSQ
jgi:zinc protease